MLPQKTKKRRRLGPFRHATRPSVARYRRRISASSHKLVHSERVRERQELLRPRMALFKAVGHIAENSPFLPPSQTGPRILSLLPGPQPRRARTTSIYLSVQALTFQLSSRIAPPGSIRSAPQIPIVRPHIRRPHQNGRTRPPTPSAPPPIVAPPLVLHLLLGRRSPARLLVLRRRPSLPPPA